MAARRVPPLRRGLVAACALALAAGVTAGLSACGPGDDLASRARDGGDGSYQVGDGAIEQIGPDKRGAPVDLKGTLLDGKPWSRASDAAGKVVVVNLWGSWCGPCESEAPHLVAAAKALTKKHPQVTFLGIDTAEAPDTGAAAATRQGLPYPSLSDPDRSAGVMLQGKVSNPPATLVLDTQGRIAARINGELTSTGTLSALVDDVVAKG